MDYCTTVTVIADYHTIKTNIKQVKKDKLRKVLCILGEGLDSNINELKRKYKYYLSHKFANIRNENNLAKSKQSKRCILLAHFCRFCNWTLKKVTKSHSRKRKHQNIYMWGEVFVYKCGRKVQSSILPHHSRPGPPSPSRGGARGEGTRTLVWFPSPLAAGSGFFKEGVFKVRWGLCLPRPT